MLAQNEVQDYLRRRLIADLHLGRLKPGDRAPSLRMVAADLCVGIRAVSRAYSQLAQEGLVLIRGRSGVYIAPTASLAPQLSEPQAWYSTILTDAWRRRIPLPQLPELLQRFVSRRLRCTCIESTEDHLIAFCSELDEDFGLDTLPLLLSQSDDGSNERKIREAVSSTDFVVTTAFHASEVRPIAQPLNKPVVIVSVNEALVQAIQTKLAEQPVVILVADRRFAERVQEYLVDAFADHGSLRVEVVDEYLRAGVRLDGEALATRAARKQLKEPEFHLVAESIPFLSLDAAREITQCMIAVQDHAAALQPA